MQPIEFKESNKTLMKPDNLTADECGSLPVYVEEDICTSCWQPTLRERLSILIWGKIWLWVWSGETQPPVALEGKKTVFQMRKNVS